MGVRSRLPKRCGRGEYRVVSVYAEWSRRKKSHRWCIETSDREKTATGCYGSQRRAVSECNKIYG